MERAEWWVFFASVLKCLGPNKMTIDKSCDYLVKWGTVTYQTGGGKLGVNFSLVVCFNLPEAYSEPCETSKMQRFAKVINGS